MIKEISAIITGILFIVLVICSSMIFETNTYGNYQIKHAAGTGNVTVRNEAGLYLQMFGTITTYPVSEDIDFEDNGL